jgi:hypothetical protein
MLKKIYCDHGTLMNINKNKQPMVVNKELLTKSDQTTKIRFFWNCEKDDIDKENYQYNKVA